MLVTLSKSCLGGLRRAKKQEGIYVDRSYHALGADILAVGQLLVFDQLAGPHIHCHLFAAFSQQPYKRFFAIK
jgi:hypothetical protein